MRPSREEMRRLLRLYAVTDQRWLKKGQTLLEAAELALKGGVTLLQVREKDLPAEELIPEAEALAALCHRYGVPLIVNDSVPAALQSGADGVHLGQSDLPRAGSGFNIRAIMGEDKILGITAKTVEQAKAAEEAGADYIGTGAVFGSSTKKDALAMSVEQFREIVSSVRIPVVAIGGINRDNIHKLAGCGASGVAVVSGIFAAEDIEAAARELSGISGELFSRSRD